MKKHFGAPSLSRRHVLGLGAGLLSATQFRRAAAAADPEAGVHGLSVFGDLKYPADFGHFDYVNTAAPKGGLFSLIPSVRAFNQSFYTFNSLNAYVLKGEGAQGMDMTFATLMARAGDEPDAMYGFAAKSVQISPDKLVYRFTMRPEARFHDGSKLAAQDAAFFRRILAQEFNADRLAIRREQFAVADFKSGLLQQPRRLTQIAAHRFRIAADGILVSLGEDFRRDLVAHRFEYLQFLAFRQTG